MNQNIQSSEVKFLHTVNSLLKGIEKNSPINRFVLCRLNNVTPRQYSSIHPYLMEAYPDKIEFDNNTKNWTWIEKKEKTPVIEETIDLGVVADE